ncbi:hypothetical protein TRICI_001960 [Trichomonascus ciferrii]|uniref:Uncharacterized protein n=1 Tax=Trichomonascus ciferrii TaxID=44093 RepID=A0A642V9I1_9ASCO|nr:hypothetical protein TRICI_001960 [Trichomonascus ciferrii]
MRCSYRVIFQTDRCRLQSRRGPVSRRSFIRIPVNDLIGFASDEFQFIELTRHRYATELAVMLIQMRSSKRKIFYAYCSELYKSGLIRSLREKGLPATGTDEERVTHLEQIYNRTVLPSSDTITIPAYFWATWTYAFK